MFILASASPRRADLLEQIGAVFRIEVSEADEKTEGALASEIVLYNAKAKAEAVARRFPNMPVLGADTVVVLDGKIYGKPKDEQEAAAMLEKLSGRTHEVLTGIVWAVGGQLWQDIAVTKVSFARMSSAQIAEYIATGEPMGKAGGYAMQGRAEMFITGIEGAYSNVVGLPLNVTVTAARKAGVDMFGENAFL